MTCPKCHKRNSTCIDSRLHAIGRRRRRLCANRKCKHRWTTYEIDESYVLELQAAWKALAIIRGKV